MKKTPLILGIACLGILASCKKDMNEATPETTAETGDQMFQPQTTQKYVPNELLVKFKPGVAANGRGSALLRIGGSVNEQIVTNAMRQAGDNEGFFVVKTTMDPLEAMKVMKGSAEIEYAEPNWIYTYGAVSADPNFTNGSMWGLYGATTSPANQFGSHAAAAWAAGHTGSKSVYVGIIDEGIQFTHPELDANIWINPFDPADGIDNDGNGYIDDIRGWDFAANDNSIYDGGTRGSLDDHGTHVAGTIGAENNGTTVVGVNWDVTMISGKFLGRNGGSTTGAVKAVDYFTDLKRKHGLNIVATNNSWGGGGYSQALYDAISRANNAGILFVAAAGNGGSDGVGDDNDVTASYPSNYDLPNVIAVASITSAGQKSGFSNFGAATVDLGAPGSAINSTTAFNTISSYSGTSMATPHVTGGVALYSATNNLTPKTATDAASIKSAILNSTTPTPSLTGKCVTGGRLNVAGF